MLFESFNANLIVSVSVGSGCVASNDNMKPNSMCNYVVCIVSLSIGLFYLAPWRIGQSLRLQNLAHLSYPIRLQSE